MTDKSNIIIKKLDSLEKRIAKIEKLLNKFFGRFEENTVGGGEKDLLLPKAVKIIQQFERASSSLLQRRLVIGYARAARLLDQLEAEGFVGPAIGSVPRKVLKKS